MATELRRVISPGERESPKASVQGPKWDEKTESSSGIREKRRRSKVGHLGEAKATWISAIGVAIPVAS